VKRLVRAGEGVWALEYRNDIANQTNTHTNYIYLRIFFKYVICISLCYSSGPTRARFLFLVGLFILHNRFGYFVAVAVSLASGASGPSQCECNIVGIKACQSDIAATLSPFP
jgi:hypothetical protein